MGSRNHLPSALTSCPWGRALVGPAHPPNPKTPVRGCGPGQGPSTSSKMSHPSPGDCARSPITVTALARGLGTWHTGVSPGPPLPRHHLETRAFSWDGFCPALWSRSALDPKPMPCSTVLPSGPKRTSFPRPPGPAKGSPEDTRLPSP